MIKKILLHIVTPIANLIAYLIAFALMRCWSYFLGFLSFAVPDGYKTRPGGLLWAVICSVFGVMAMAYITNTIAPSGKLAHYIFSLLIVPLISVLGIFISGLNLINGGEFLGLIIGSVIGYYTIQNKKINA